MFFCFWGFMNSQEKICLNKPIPLYLWEEFCLNLTSAVAFLLFSLAALWLKKTGTSHYNMQFSCDCVRLEFSEVLGWAVSTVPGILWSSTLLQLHCPCFILKNHTGMLYNRKREHISLSNQLSVSSGFTGAVLGCANKLKEMTRNTGRDSEIQTYAVERKGAVRGETNAG